MIPFYGAQHPDLFAIERSAMDRPGHVLRALDDLLPAQGRLLDVGAGNGFYARSLSQGNRSVVPLEPNPGMIDPSAGLDWVRGVAERLPFANASFSGVLATWAYFFPSYHSIMPGFREAVRVLGSPGVFIIVNNLGGDELSSLAGGRELAEPSKPFTDLGFTVQTVETCFSFQSLEDARALLGFYFGDAGRRVEHLEVGYRVAVSHLVV